MTLTDYQIRKLPPALRRELFNYVPRVRARGMKLSKLKMLLNLYSRYDLYQRVAEELDGEE